MMESLHGVVMHSLELFDHLLETRDEKTLNCLAALAERAISSALQEVEGFREMIGSMFPRPITAETMATSRVVHNSFKAWAADAEELLRRARMLRRRGLKVANIDQLD